MFGIIIPLIVLFIFIGPYFTIMALNTLFGLGIAVTGDLVRNVLAASSTCS